MNQQTFFATAPIGLELLLEKELQTLGATNTALKLAGVSFQGDLQVAYRACLWSRLANRVLFPLTEFSAATPEALYAGVQTINWPDHLTAKQTLAVHFVSSRSTITHTLFGAQKVKDAIVDQMRERIGERPNVSRATPDISVYLYLRDDKATVYLDLSGESLHKRGYRLSAGVAPLKENLAAAILLRANWETLAKEGCTLIDPMCGSGTFLIEGAMIAADIAPGLKRHYFGFLGWKQHDAAVWETLVAEAKSRALIGMSKLPRLIGLDHDKEAILKALENINAAGFAGKIHIEKRDVALFAPTERDKTGLVIVNPPYGERLGEVDALKSLYTTLGERLKTHFVGWQAAVFTGNPDLGKEMGIRAKHYYALFNGAIACKLLLFAIEPQYFVDRSVGANNERRINAAKRFVAKVQSSSLEMLKNRLRKNLKHFGRQARRANLKSVRVYDKDLPEYQFALDLNEGSLHVFEYQVSRAAPEAKVVQHRHEFLAVLPEIFSLPAAKIFFHERE